MKQVKLNDIVTVVTQRADDSDLPYIEIGDIDIDTKQYLIKSKKVVDNAIRAIRNDVIVSKVRPTRGAVTIIKDDCFVSNAFIVMRGTSAIYPFYLFHALARNSKFFSHLGKFEKGATYPTCTTKDVLSFSIAVPDNYDDQIRIASVLTYVEKMIAKRKENIIVLDEFLKSTFLAMFGNPVSNEKGWARDSLKNLCGFITKGTTPKSNDIFNTFQNGFIPFIKVYHICNDGSINFNDSPSFISQETHTEFLKRSIVYPNDILMNIVGPPLGKIGIVPNTFQEWNVNQAIVIFRCGVKLNPKYLLFALKSNNFCNAIIKMAVGIRQLNLSLEQCRNINIPVPPVSLQHQFADIVEQVELLKSKYTQSLSELENLYGSLSQLSFKGELDLRRVPIEPRIESEFVPQKNEASEFEEVIEELFSDEEIINAIENILQTPMTFDELYKKLDDDLDIRLESEFAMQPLDYGRVKEIIFKQLEGNDPLLTQYFDEKEKRIMLRVTK